MLQPRVHCDALANDAAGGSGKRRTIVRSQGVEEARRGRCFHLSKALGGLGAAVVARVLVCLARLWMNWYPALCERRYGSTARRHAQRVAAYSMRRAPQRLAPPLPLLSREAGHLPAASQHANLPLTSSRLREIARDCRNLGDTITLVVSAARGIAQRSRPRPLERLLRHGAPSQRCVARVRSRWR